VSNTYQKNSRRAQPDRLPGEVTVPEQVIVSMAEIARSAREGLLALAVGTGLQVMAAMFDEDATRPPPKSHWALELSSGLGTLAAAGMIPIRCGAAGLATSAARALDDSGC
jgi:hypothetical protein